MAYKTFIIDLHGHIKGFSCIMIYEKNILQRNLITLHYTIINYTMLFNNIDQIST